ncbi:TIR domain-containing protein [Bradyrhizobium sp. th.b2]|uniref:TIR domain-containing protein n=1 Tax=Bradyrhizobium sp. th-b2 TaxID=172088 RepID=UPI00040432BF|nr:TIR domain-containing protein [Bradyrhizobium sp. th.b2]
MAENSIKNVFISHVHEDDHGLGKTKDLLAKNGMTIRDGSINSEKPNKANADEYIKSEILAPRIKWAGTFITYITPHTKDSEWVNWEIEYAEKQGKRIVGIWGHGHKDCEVPEALKKYADAVVPWNAEKIMDAIDGKLTDWQDPEGKPLPVRPIARANC